MYSRTQRDHNYEKKIMWRFGMILFLTMALVATARADTAPPPPPPPPPATTLYATGISLSATALFASAMEERWLDEKICEKPLSGIPSVRIRARHERAIPASTAPWWGDDQSKWILMAELLFSESDGHPGKNSKPTESTYGFYCLGVDEVRETHRQFPYVPCPKSSREIVEWLRGSEKLEWQTLVMAGTLYRYMRMYHYDPVMGVLSYKMGGGKLADVIGGLKGAPVTSLNLWKTFKQRGDELMCHRDRILMNAIITPCGCNQGN